MLICCFHMQAITSVSCYWLSWATVLKTAIPTSSTPQWSLNPTIIFNMCCYLNECGFFKLWRGAGNLCSLCDFCNIFFCYLHQRNLLFLPPLLHRNLKWELLGFGCFECIESNHNWMCNYYCCCSSVWICHLGDQSESTCPLATDLLLWGSSSKRWKTFRTLQGALVQQNHVRPMFQGWFMICLKS